MPLLFSYGTLRDEQVQLTLFGRTLIGRKDTLLGYEQRIAPVADPSFVAESGQSHHAILRPAQSSTAQVEGMALEVTENELAITDAYEPKEYRRVIARLASGAETWVYVDAHCVGNVQ